VLRQYGKENFVFTLTTSDKEVIFTSQVYPDKDSALRGIGSVRGNVRKKDRYLLRTAVNGQHFFVLESTNQGVLGQSRLYEDPESLQQGLAMFKRSTLAAKLEDWTFGNVPLKHKR
jgi:uncharacterized protein YegP (UPF0339 family)